MNELLLKTFNETTTYKYTWPEAEILLISQDLRSLNIEFTRVVTLNRQ
jgi:hypothetical protein